MRGALERKRAVGCDQINTPCHSDSAPPIYIIIWGGDHDEEQEILFTFNKCSPIIFILDDLVSKKNSAS